METYGTRYVVVTTLQYGYKPAIQYDYKPSTNYVSLIVDPQSSQAIQPTKTLEQMQTEAEQSGWLTIWHEFSWSYPWYRMHLLLNVPLPPYGRVYIDYGWSPLPFGMSFQTNVTVFALLLDDIGADTATGIILGFAVGYVIQRVAAGVAGKTVVGVLGAIIGYTAYSVSTSIAGMSPVGTSQRLGWEHSFPLRWLLLWISCFKGLKIFGSG